MTEALPLNGSEVAEDDVADVLVRTAGNVTVVLPYRSQVEIGLCSFFLLILIVTALLGNTAVIYAIVSTPRLRDHISNMFIINLSIADMTTACVVMCTSFVALAWDLTEVNQVWCDLVCAANYCMIIVSMLTLAFISVDRYIAVIHPLRYNCHITRGRVVMVICWAWLQGAAFAAAPIIKHWIHYDYWEVVCAIAWHEEKPQSIYYVIIAFIVCFGFPGVIMVCCYSKVIKEAARCKTESFGIQKGSKSTTKTIRSLLVVVTLFFLCMTPFCVTKLLKVIFTDPNFVPPYANLTASYMGYVSSVVNPFIYAIFRSDFRNAYRRLWWRVSCRCFGRQMEMPTNFNNSSSFTANTRQPMSMFRPATKVHAASPVTVAQAPSTQTVSPCSNSQQTLVSNSPVSPQLAPIAQSLSDLHIDPKDDRLIHTHYKSPNIPPLENVKEKGKCDEKYVKFSIVTSPDQYVYDYEFNNLSHTKDVLTQID